MTAVGHVVRFMVLDLGTLHGVECALTSARLTPSVSVQTVHTACPSGSVVAAAPATWTFDLTYNTDTVDGSLSNFLVEHEGETVTVEWQPDTTTARIRTFDVIVIPGSEDNNVTQMATGSVSLPVIGTPRWKPAAAGAAAAPADPAPKPARK